MAGSDNEKLLKFLYTTPTGRFFLKALSAPLISKIAGAYLSSFLSKPLIKGFVKRNNIDLSEFYSDDFHSFNDCFSRKIKENLRPIDLNFSALISPCDGLLTVYDINKNTVLPIKQSRYTISSLLKDEILSREFEGGKCLVFRLMVNHYHRYCFLDGGTIEKNYFIKGKLHTVRPIALENIPVFCENCREVSVIDYENLGKTVQIEVGAMMVGKIKNHKLSSFSRGQEKGMFLFGGSTIIVLLKKDAAKLDDNILDNSLSGIETDVKFGQKIGSKN